MATEEKVAKLDRKLRKKKLGDLAYKLEQEYSDVPPVHRSKYYDEMDRTNPGLAMKKMRLNPRTMKENVLGYSKKILTSGYEGGKSEPNITDIVKNIAQLKRRKEDPDDITDYTGITDPKDTMSAKYGGENKSFSATNLARRKVAAEKELKKKSSVLGRLRGLLGLNS